MDIIFFLEDKGESYQASTKLYLEVEQMKNRSIDDRYYEAHMPIVKDRIQKAGLRLAGVLNMIFENKGFDDEIIPLPEQEEVPSITKSNEVVKLTVTEDIPHYIGKTITIRDKVYSAKELSAIILLNVGADYPNQKLTLVIKGNNKDKFKGRAEAMFVGKTVEVTGKVTEYKGKPQIEISDLAQIKVVK